MKKFVLFGCFLVSLNLALSVSVSGQSYEFSDGFEDGSKIELPWQRGGSYTTITDQISLTGKRAFRAHMKPRLYDNARSEITFKGANGMRYFQDLLTTYGFKVAIYFPNDFEPDFTSNEIILQYHGKQDKHDTYTNPPFGVYLEGDKLRVTTRWIKRDPGSNDDKVTISYRDVATVQPGKWHFFVVDIHWDYRANGNGFAKVYMKVGSPPKESDIIVNHEAPIGSKDDDGPYFKMGIYKWDWKNQSKVDRSVKAGITHRTLYYDDFQIKKGAILTGQGPQNNVPTANAGKDQTIILPANTVNLTGSASDSDGNIASVKWTKVKGGNASIVSSTKNLTQVRDLVEGEYTFRFTATDNDGETAFDDVKVTVLPANRAPVANAGKDITITLPTNKVTVNGTASDTDGSVVSVQWEKVSGGSAIIVDEYQRSTQIHSLDEGEYVFRFTATDNDGATKSDNLRVIVLPEPPNEKPIVNAGADINISLPVNTISLTGSVNDPDGTIDRVEWTIVSGGSATIASKGNVSTDVTNLAAGSYTFKLTAWDDDGASASDNVFVTVLEEVVNTPPVVDAGPNQTVILPENSIVTAATANDPDGSITEVTWAKLAGGAATIVSRNQLTTEINNLEEGTYTFRVTVRDNDGTTAADNFTVTVLPQANDAPTASAGEDITVTLPQNSVELQGIASDADGSVASVLWKKISGGSASIATAAQRTTQVNSLTEGAYVFEFVVTDNLGATASDRVNVTVLPAAANQAPIVNAGNDQVIQLPVDFALLTATANDPDGSIAEVAWTKVSGGNATLQNSTELVANIANLELGDYVFRITATDNEGLSASDEVKISVIDANLPPVVNLARSTSISLPLESYEIDADAYDPDGEIVAYAWTQEKGPEIFISEDDSPILLLQELSVGNYVFKVVVTDNKGATTEASIRIKASLDMNKVAGIPRVFSPDGNGIDDYWIFEDASIIEGCSLVIFNRQGRKVYESDSYQNDWDGTYNGTPLPEGDYYYVIKCDDGGEPLTGGVRILRQ